MRATVSCAMALLAAVALSAASFVHLALAVRAGSGPAARPAYCATKADRTSIVAHSKTSSFAPHAGPHSRVYGVPIQSRILKSRPKKKPQLTSSPLPDGTGANNPSGG
jgi:hypothetical protein